MMHILMVNFSFLTPLVASSCPPALHPAQREPWCSAGPSQPPRLHHRAHHPPHHYGGGWSGGRQRERGAPSRAGGNGNPLSMDTKESQLLQIMLQAYTTIFCLQSSFLSNENHLAETSHLLQIDYPSQSVAPWIILKSSVGAVMCY